MKNKFLIASLIAVAALAACRKNNDDIHSKELMYAGSTDALSEGRYDIQVYQTGNYTCFSGGAFYTMPAGETASSNTDVYDHASGNWTRFGLSVKRFLYGAAALNNKLVIGGGYSPTNPFSAAVDIFDLATGQITYASLSVPRSQLSAAGAGNKILFAGGATSTTIFATVDIYNTETGKWTIDSLSLGRALTSAAAAGNKIVFAGGIARSGNTNYYSDRTDIYDVQTGKWTQATLSQPRQGMTAIAAGDKIFFAGGSSPTGISENVDIYDVKANRWTVVPLSGNTLNRISACTNGSQVFFTSGANYNFTKLHIYDLAGSQMQTVPLPIAHRGSSVTAAGRKVFMPMGVMNDTVTSKILVYDIGTKLFDSTSYRLPEKKTRTASAAGGSKIMVAGGVYDGKNAANQPQTFNYKTVSVFDLR